MYGKNFGKWNPALVLLIAVAGWLFQGQMARAQVNARYVPIINTLTSPGNTALVGSDSTLHLTVLVTALAYDAAGDLYIVDGGNSATPNGVIYKVDATTGYMSVLAGQPGTPVAIGSAVLAGPLCKSGVAPSYPQCGDGGAASSAYLNAPYQIVFDRTGNAYIADSNDSRIRKIALDPTTNTLTPNSIITTVVGTGTHPNATNSNITSGGIAGASANLGYPKGLAFDPTGRYLYIAASSGSATAGNSTVEVYDTSTGQVSRFVGTNVGGTATTTPVLGPGASAWLPYSGATAPNMLAADSKGNLYYTDTAHNEVYQITPSANVQIYAGNGSASYGGDGGQATAAAINAPYSIAVDAKDSLYILTNANNAVREVNSQGVISTVVGTGTNGTTTNLLAAAGTLLTNVKSVAVSPDMSTIVIGYGNGQGGNVVKYVSINNGFPATAVGATYTTPAETISVGPPAVTTISGINVQATTSGTAQAYQIDPSLVSANFSMNSALTTTTPSTATTTTPPAVTTTPVSMNQWDILTGQVIFQPTAPGLRTSRVMLTDSTGANYYLGVYGVGDGAAAAFTPGTISAYVAAAGGTVTATLGKPVSVALDAVHNLYIADAETGTVSKVSGTSITPVATGFIGAMSVAVDAAEDVFIADTAGNCIQGVSANTGATSPVPGTCGLLSSPSGVATDGAGNLYIADSGNNVIREVGVYSGGITILAGTAGSSGNADGPAASATFNNPQGLAVDTAGNVYVADTGNGSIRKISHGTVSTVASVTAPTAIAVDAADNLYVTGIDGVSLVNPAGNIMQIAGGGPTNYLAATAPTLSTAANLSQPSGIAVDEKGNYYIADNLNSTVAYVNAASPTMMFGDAANPINVGTTSGAQAISLVNIGNRPLTLNGVAATANTTNGSDFNLYSTTCTTGTPLNPGEICAINVTFTPSAKGTTSGTVTVADNALNTTGSTQTINLTGYAAAIGGPAAITATAGSGQTMNPLGTFTAPLQVKVVDASGLPVNGATVTFTINAGTAPATFANGLTMATATTNSGGIATSPSLIAGQTQGNFTVTATVAGLTVDPGNPTTFAIFSETAFGTILPAVTVTIAPPTPQYGQSVTVTVTLTASSLGILTNATGTVALYDNGTSVGTDNLTNGTATITYAPSAGSHSLTAIYSGDTNFGSSNSNSTPVSVTVAQLPVTGAISPSAPSSLPYGTTLPTITGSLTGVLPQDAGNVQLMFALPSGTPVIPNAGTYLLNAVLTGSKGGNYSVTVAGAPVLIITPAVTTTTLKVDNLSPAAGGTMTLTATVASTTGGPDPTGTVTFTSGTSTLGTASLGGGVAALTVATPTAGSQSISAIYTPANGNYSSSGSTILTVTVIDGDFSFTNSFNAVTVQQGSTVNIPITLTSNTAFSGTVTFGCSGLPTNSTCSFTPATVTYSTAAGNSLPGSSVPVLLQVSTAGSTALTIAENRTPSGITGITGITFAAIFLPGALFAGVIGRRCRQNGVFRTLYVLVVMTIGLGTAGLINGCGVNFTDKNSVVTPTGPASVTVTARSGSIVHSATIAISVAAK